MVEPSSLLERFLELHRCHTSHAPAPWNSFVFSRSPRSSAAASSIPGWKRLGYIRFHL